MLHAGSLVLHGSESEAGAATLLGCGTSRVLLGTSGRRTALSNMRVGHKTSVFQDMVQARRMTGITPGAQVATREHTGAGLIKKVVGVAFLFRKESPFITLSL